MSLDQTIGDKLMKRGEYLPTNARDGRLCLLVVNGVARPPDRVIKEERDSLCQSSDKIGDRTQRVIFVIELAGDPPIERLDPRPVLARNAIL